MGGYPEPPEEPMFAGLEDGFGYFTAAAPGHGVRHYEFVRKVIVSFRTGVRLMASM
jgi:hypothetical protein